MRERQMAAQATKASALPVSPGDPQGIGGVMALGRLEETGLLGAGAGLCIAEDPVQSKQRGAIKDAALRVERTSRQASPSSQAATQRSVVYFRLRCWMVFSSPEDAAA